MAFKKKATTKRKPRRTQRKRKFQNVPAVNRMVRLGYVHEYTRTPSIAPLVQSFSCNSLWKPDYIGSGHQPYGYDQLTPIFDRYRVLGFSVKVNLLPLTGSCHVGVIFMPATGTIAGMTIANMKELPNSFWQIVHHDTDSSNLFIKRSIASLMGEKKSVIENNTDYDSVTSGNPGIQAICHVVVQNVDLLTSTVIVGNINLKYEAKMYARDLLSFS